MSGKANETISLFISKLSETTGYKYLKSSKSLKKTIGQIVFEVIFFSSKWNDDNNIEINADFRVSYKKYGATSSIHSIVASKGFQSGKEYWYDISSKDNFEETLKYFEMELQTTAVDLSNRFDKDFKDACQYLLEEKFSEYHVFFDFLIDVLGEESQTSFNLSLVHLIHSFQLPGIQSLMISRLLIICNRTLITAS